METKLRFLKNICFKYLNKSKYFKRKKKKRFTDLMAYKGQFMHFFAIKFGNSIHIYFGENLTQSVFPTAVAKRQKKNIDFL